MSRTDGSASSPSDAGFCMAVLAASRPTAATPRAKAIDRPSMRGSPVTLCPPSDSHMTAKTQADAVSVETETPARAATQLQGPDRTVSCDRTVNTVVARQPASAYCARLNASLTLNWRRCSRRVKPTPATRAATRVAGSIR